MILYTFVMPATHLDLHMMWYCFLRRSHYSDVHVMCYEIFVMPTIHMCVGAMVCVFGLVLFFVFALRGIFLLALAGFSRCMLDFSWNDCLALAQVERLDYVVPARQEEEEVDESSLPPNEVRTTL